MKILSTMNLLLQYKEKPTMSHKFAWITLCYRLKKLSNGIGTRQKVLDNAQRLTKTFSNMKKAKFKL